MSVFITGTGTEVGKTTIASWLALHTGFAYFKPIQTGLREGSDSDTVRTLSGGVHVYPECYCYEEPVSPHLAAKLSNDVIDLNRLSLPRSDQLIVEGAGGVCVPINDDQMMVDLIVQCQLPVILVALSGLGTINHTVLSVKVLRSYGIQQIKVIMNGVCHPENQKAIEHYGKTQVVMSFPFLETRDYRTLQSIPLSHDLTHFLLGK